MDNIIVREDIILLTYARSFKTNGRLIASPTNTLVNFGRDIVFSADLCYNGTNEKPPSEREGDRVSGGRSLRDFGLRFNFIITHSPSPDFVGSSLPEGALGHARH